MSIRAYKLIEIKTEKEPTFNLSSNYYLYDLAATQDDTTLTFEKEVLEEVLNDKEQLATLASTAEQDLDTIKDLILNILKDIGTDTEVTYYCY